MKNIPGALASSADCRLAHAWWTSVVQARIAVLASLGHVPCEEEEVRLVLDRRGEPWLLDHILDLLHGRVVVVAGEVEENAERGDLLALARLKLREAIC